MVKVICKECGKKYKDKHPERKGDKFCCRKHWQDYIRTNGTWNKGKKWKEIYKKETLKKMMNRIGLTGEQHFNYNRSRPDLLMRNFLNNPSKSFNQNKEIQQNYKKNPKETLQKMIQNSNPKKELAYQRKAFKKYGRKCLKCGVTKGQIDVHHIDGNHKNNKINNLIVYCASCHAKFHKKTNRGD